MGSSSRSKKIKSRRWSSGSCPIMRKRLTRVRAASCLYVCERGYASCELITFHLKLVPPAWGFGTSFCCRYSTIALCIRDRVPCTGKIENTSLRWKMLQLYLPLRSLSSRSKKHPHRFSGTHKYESGLSERVA